VPETTLTDSLPGDIFVHRNIANVVSPGEASAAAAITFAVGFVGVKHVVVCGHTRCGGAHAALGDKALGAHLDAWLEPVRALRRDRAADLAKLETEDEKADALAEWNVRRSLETLAAMDVVRDKVSAGKLQIHGMIYDVASCELRLITA
jgi:carbonic anhydrase